MRRGVLVLFIIVIIGTFALSGIYAQEADSIEDSNGLNESSDSGGVDFQDATAVLSESEGITPDSSFYFVDNFFDKFSDDVKVRQEKVAEIRAMIEAGKYDDGRKALEKYKEYADKLEKEVSPEQRDEARKSAAAIYNVLKSLESQIPEEYRQEFVDDVVEREGKIVTSAEIAAKIKDLCETLSEIDPLEYFRVCNVDDGAPEWQKRLDKDLTDKQREEAQKFGRIMSQCFKTSGQECSCDEIPFAEFAETCSIAAPLAVACDVEGNEDACEKLDNLEMPELPDHLQDVFDDLERDISDSQFELHVPFECREAGVTTSEACRKIMIETNAPEECRQALINANVQTEREGREICEKIMFELNAPQECIDAGLTDHRECGRFMFQQNAPQECIDAGLTGEHQSDPKKCEELMRSLGRDNRGPNSGPGHGFGGNCRDIQNPEERLKCYDGATQGVRDFDDRSRETRQVERQCAEKCLNQGAAWDFSNGNCKCNTENNFYRNEFGGNPNYDCSKLDCQQGYFCDPYEGCIQSNSEDKFDCSSIKCSEGQSCSPYYGCLSPELRQKEIDEFSGKNYESSPKPGDPNYVDNTAKYDCSKLNCGSSPNYCDPWQGCVKGEDGYNSDGSSCDQGYEWDGSKCIPFGTGDYGFENNCPEGQYYDSNGICTSGGNEEVTESGPEEVVEEEPDNSVIGDSSGGNGGETAGTGAVITGNAFLNYYFR